MGGRTNAEGAVGPLSARGYKLAVLHTSAGIDQLRTLVEPLGMHVTAVRMSKVLHLKSAVTALPDGRIIGHLPSLDSDHPFLDLVATPDNEVNGAHVVSCGDVQCMRVWCIARLEWPCSWTCIAGAAWL